MNLPRPAISALMADRAVFGFEIGGRNEEHIVATDAHAMNQRGICGRGGVVRIWHRFRFWRMLGGGHKPNTSIRGWVKDSEAAKLPKANPANKASDVTRKASD